ncbi:MAG: hypothetical protein R8G66_21315 [Cytophagales bacterium]|nr:hypothetical protein [Cytophagales bacterium]
MKELINLLVKLFNLIVGLTFLVAFLFVGVLFLNGNPEWVASWSDATEEEVSLTMIKSSEIVDGVHTPTGLLDGPGLDMVIRNCTGCHSAKLITQNKATASGWRGTIQWMQETQGLWQLGENEEIIVWYLAEFYAPVDEGRRRNLPTPEWYELD